MSFERSKNWSSDQAYCTSSRTECQFSLFKVTSFSTPFLQVCRSSEIMSYVRFQRLPRGIVDKHSSQHQQRQDHDHILLRKEFSNLAVIILDMSLQDDMHDEVIKSMHQRSAWVRILIVACWTDQTTLPSSLCVWYKIENPSQPWRMYDTNLHTY